MIRAKTWAVVTLCLAVGTISTQAKVRYRWTVETTNYAVEIAPPLQDIPAEGAWDLSRGNESLFANLAASGYTIFSRMRNEQAATIWFQCRISDTGQCLAYDGALGSLVARTAHGDSIHVASLLCSPISLDDLTAPPLTVLCPGVSWDRMKCVSRARIAWVLFAGFPRIVDPGEIDGFTLSRGAVPCGR